MQRKSVLIIFFFTTVVLICNSQGIDKSFKPGFYTVKHTCLDSFAKRTNLMPKIDSALKAIYSPKSIMGTIYNLCIYIDSIDNNIINFNIIRVQTNNALYQPTVPFNISLEKEYKIEINDLFFRLNEGTKIYSNPILNSTVLYTTSEGSGIDSDLKKIAIIDNLNDIRTQTWVKLLFTYSSTEKKNNAMKNEWTREVWVETNRICLTPCYK